MIAAYANYSNSWLLGKLMLVVFLAWWCAGVGAQLRDAEYARAERAVHDDVDFDDYYSEEDTPTTVRADTHTRVRKHDPSAPTARTLSDEEIREIKAMMVLLSRVYLSVQNRVLKDFMSGRNTFALTSTLAKETVMRLTSIYHRVTRAPMRGSNSSIILTRTKEIPTKDYENIIEEIMDQARRQGEEHAPMEITTGMMITSDEFLENENEDLKPNITETSEDSEEKEEKNLEEIEDTTTSEPVQIVQTTTTDLPTTTTMTPCPTSKYTRKTRRKTTTTTTPKEVIDVDTLVRIIANLTLDYELMNITDLFNKTLMEYKIPKCLAPETTTWTETTEEEIVHDLENASIISKCFVCGLQTYGIPRNSYCADAFAGDFLPLVPIDPKAKGQVARYRKYCRYLDVPGVYENGTFQRSVYGRWTGGCAVRWVDLSGVYTQRVCRNRRRPVMGNHFLSKRMAKLELALNKQDNGCLISPMSSLVPLSRGISLYARFHACVCTGNWCNTTPQPGTLHISLLDPAFALLVAVVWM